MKVRTGFVSNSSSSSFILAYAKVNMNNLDAFNKWKDEHSKMFKDDDFQIVSFKHLDEDHRWKPYVKYDNNIILESFQTDLSFDLTDEDDLVVIVNIANNEGDDAFMDSCDEDSDIDYDIDWEFFNDDLKKTIDDFSKRKDIFGKTDLTYGAGRNG